MKKVYLDIETYTKGDKPTVSDKVIAIGITEGSEKHLITGWEYEREGVIRKFYEKLS